MDATDNRDPRCALRRLAVQRGWGQRYAGPHRDVRLRTRDGVGLAATYLPGPERAEVCVVVCHGFLAHRLKPKVRVLAEALSERFAVLALDFRGHGDSAGSTSTGQTEVLDVQAAVAYARDLGHEKVATLGMSMGGVIVVRHAGLFGGSDLVVSISAPAQFYLHDSPALEQATWLMRTGLGRTVARWILGVRISLKGWNDAIPPEKIVARLAPTPLLIVHGTNDHYFAIAQAEMLFERAEEPKELWVEEGFGHSEDGLTPQFSVRLRDALARMLGGDMLGRAG